MLAKVLFSMFGFDFKVKDLLKVIAAIAVAGVLYLAYDAIRDHFQHIKTLEETNATLTKDNEVLTGQLDIAVQANVNNEKVADLKEAIDQQNEVIAANERAAEKARAATQKEVLSAIKTARPANDSRTIDPVAPVILDVTDRLWGRQGSVDSPAAGGQEGDGDSNPG